MQDSPTESQVHRQRYWPETLGIPWEAGVRTVREKGVVLYDPNGYEPLRINSCSSLAWGQVKQGLLQERFPQGHACGEDFLSTSSAAQRRIIRILKSVDPRTALLPTSVGGPQWAASQ